MTTKIYDEDGQQVGEKRLPDVFHLAGGENVVFRQPVRPIGGACD
jgi:hypothetical protein